MSNREPDVVVRSLAAMGRKQDEIAQAWLARLQGSGSDDGAHGGRGEAAARVVAAVCERLAPERDRQPEGRPDSAGGQGEVSGLRVAGHEEVAALSGLHAVLLESAAAELHKVPGASIDDAFRISAAIGEALAGVRAELTESAPAVSEAAGEPERFQTFARTIAHELKNPLGAARGAAELLATGEGLETEESRARFAELVLRNVNRALELLDDVRAKA